MTDVARLALVDSNTWIFYLDRTLPEHAKVAPALERVLAEHELLLTTVVQMEVAHYVVRRMGEGASRALDALFEIDAHLEGLDPEDALQAVELLKAHAKDGLGGRDATLLHAARKHRVGLLCTSDRVLARAARRMGVPVKDLAPA